MEWTRRTQKRCCDRKMLTKEFFTKKNPSWEILKAENPSAFTPGGWLFSEYMEKPRGPMCAYAFPLSLGLYYPFLFTLRKNAVQKIHRKHRNMVWSYQGLWALNRSVWAEMETSGEVRVEGSADQHAWRIAFTCCNRCLMGFVLMVSRRASAQGLGTSYCDS